MSASSALGDVEASFERDMAQLLALVEQLAAQPDEPALSHVVNDSEDDAASQSKLEAFFAQVLEEGSHLTVVHTRPDERSEIGTWMSWSGETHTVICAGASATALAEHQRQLQQQLLRQRLRLRLLTTTLAAAACISAKATTPARAQLALHTAWRFVRAWSVQWGSLLNL